MAIDTKLRYNPTTSEVELLVGDVVAMTSGKDVFESWAVYWAEQNGYSKTEVLPVTEPTTPAEPEVEPPVDNGEQV